MPQLDYQSGLGDALQPGEVVLWEQIQEPTSAIASTPLVLTISLMFLCAVGGAVLGLEGIIAVLIVYALGMLAWAIFAAVRRAGRRPIRARITNRRVQRIQATTAASAALVPGDIRSIVVTRAWRTRSISIWGNGRLGFTSTGNDAPERIIFGLIAGCDRRSRVRRMGQQRTLDRGSTVAGADGMMQTSMVTAPPTTESPVAPSADPLLQDGERLIWRGRPRAASLRQLWVLRPASLVWTLVPLLIAIFCGWSIWRDPTLVVPWFIGIICVLLLWGVLHSLLIHPFGERRKLRQSQYFLTNLRILTRENSKACTVETSDFLDMLSSLRLELHPDGTGTIVVGYASRLRYIENPQHVHRLLVDAIRDTGGPLQAVPPNLADPDNDLD